MNIGATIQRVRKEKGYSQERLARKIHICRVSLNNYELNKNNPRLQMIKTIAEAMEIEPIEFIKMILESE